MFGGVNMQKAQIYFFFFKVRKNDTELGEGEGCRLSTAGGGLYPPWGGVKISLHVMNNWYNPVYDQACQWSKFY